MCAGVALRARQPAGSRRTPAVFPFGVAAGPFRNLFRNRGMGQGIPKAKRSSKALCPPLLVPDTYLYICVCRVSLFHVC